MTVQKASLDSTFVSLTDNLDGANVSLDRVKYKKASLDRRINIDKTYRRLENQKLSKINRVIHTAKVSVSFLIIILVNIVTFKDTRFITLDCY